MSYDRAHPLTLLKRVQRKLRAKRRHFLRMARKLEAAASGHAKPVGRRPKPEPIED